MARTLRWDDHVSLGFCRMLDTGVFVSTRRVVRNFVSPAVFVSYAIAGLCALPSAFCYVEFVFDLKSEVIFSFQSREKHIEWGCWDET
ncbi:hypothetical protein KSP40_PGU011816 [Platanthera guangdongensis]|uniref:Transmembrane protein n=1 Tax=Platanthera guangdongensis TaxID=2320717 RepID=A0ABR2MHV8_9ASPA